MSIKVIIRMFVLALAVSEILSFQTSPSDAFRWRIPTSIKVIASIFTLVPTVSETLRFEMFDLENLGQVHGVQHLQ